LFQLRSETRSEIHGNFSFWNLRFGICDLAEISNPFL
jgi:hypothetical protein